MPMEPTTASDALPPLARALMQSPEGDIVTLTDAQGSRRMVGTGNMAHHAPGYTGLPSLKHHQRLCFYPSSGDRGLWVLLRLDCDFFLLTEQDRRSVSWRRIQVEFEQRGLPVSLIFDTERSLSFHSQGKTVVILIQDNNASLEVMRRAGVQVHHFFGVCDGCCEGGNHECVHERPFLSRLLPLAINGMAYTTDHSQPLQRELRYPWVHGNHARFRSSVHWHDFSEPPSWNRPRGPDLSDQIAPGTSFELQGVLVMPNGVVPVRGKCREADLTVLPKGPHATQLEQLKPLRTRYGSGVLAEYRVFFEQAHPCA